MTKNDFAHFLPPKIRVAAGGGSNTDFQRLFYGHPFLEDTIMSLSRFGGIVFFVCVMVIVTSNVAVANRIMNGDFQATPELSSWNVGSGTATPFALDSENDCARIVKQSNTMWQAVTLETGETGLTDFQLEFDIATLSGSGSERKFSMQLSGADGLFDSFAIEGTNSTFRAHSGGWAAGWVDSGLAVTKTTDEEGDGTFTSSETVGFSHITLIGANYGSESVDRTLTLIVDGDTQNAYTWTYDSSVDPIDPLLRIVFNGAYAQKDYLVDNVSVTAAAVPEPSVVMLLGSALCCAWLLRRKRRG